MSIILSSKGVTIKDVFYPVANMLYTLTATTVNFTLANFYPVSGDVAFGSVTNEATGLAFASMAELKAFLTTSFLKASGSGASASLIPIGAKTVVYGNSWAQGTFTDLNNQNSYSSESYVAQLQTLIGHKLYLPTSANKGVGGERIDQILARINDVFALNPRVVISTLLENDINQTRVFKNVRNYAITLFELLKSRGIVVITTTVCDTYIGTPFTQAQQTLRNSINEFVRNYPGIYVLDVDKAITKASQKRDSLHLNAEGAREVAKEGFKLLNPLFENLRTDFEYQILPTSVNNYDMNGSTSGRATGYTMPTTAAGAVVTCSKITVGTDQRQVITFSGNANAPNELVLEYSNDAQLPNIYALNDYVEGIAVIEVTQKLVGFRSVYPSLAVQGQSYVPVLGGVLGMRSTDNTTIFDVEPGIYTYKTAPYKITGAANPVQYQNKLNFMLVNAAGSVPISGQIIIHRLGSRRIPTAFEV